MFHKKSIKGLTLVEILVSCVITVMVIMYGTTFFLSSWRMEVESEEYSKVLQCICNIIEEKKIDSTGYITDEDKTFDSDDIKKNGLEKIKNITVNIKYGKKNKKFNEYNLPSNDNYGTTCIPMHICVTWTSANNKKEECVVVNTIISMNYNAFNFK